MCGLKYDVVEYRKLVFNIFSPYQEADNVVQKYLIVQTLANCCQKTLMILMHQLGYNFDRLVVNCQNFLLPKLCTTWYVTSACM